ncbi:MAG: GTPase Era [Patescibacteria group bacterium]|nr:GTPase Era [Patescibacteria group bacterium]
MTTSKKRPTAKAEAAPEKKNGLVVIVGRSNVGKSTLLNALVGTKIAITSVKPQTTRDVIHGVVHDPRGQIVFADTPGLFTHVPDTLTSLLNEKVRDSLAGVDAMLYVVDATRHVGDEEKAIHRLVALARVPKILVLNKSDRQQPFKDEYLVWSDEFDRVVEISAVDAKGIKPLLEAIFEILPAEGVPLYPEGQLTNVDNDFWFAELVREKIFNALGDELPYTTTVEIDETADRPNGMLYVKAIILTTALRYKRMIIGHKGRMIKEIGATARKEIEIVTGRKVFLDLEVRVDERWPERFE